MFRADPIREQLRHIWLAGLVVGAVIICHLAMSLAQPYLPASELDGTVSSVAWQILMGAVLICGGYLGIRDHVWRPFFTLSREIPDPAMMWWLMGCALASGLAWAPVLSLGVSVLYFEGGGIWTVLQIGALLILWTVVEKRARPSVNRIVGDIVPQSSK